jgi:hypothetical protein
MKTIWRTIGGLILGGALMLPAAHAATGYADSNITTVDTRAVGITSQPQSQTINAGANATFTVVAAGVPSFSYQWQFNGQNIGNATNATLTLNSVTAANSGGYSVVVSNPYGSVTSATASLAVLIEGANGNKPAQVSSSATLTKLPGKNNLVVVTHGCLPGPQVQPPPQWVSDMCNDIQLHSPSDWQVFPYYWTNEAWAYVSDQAALSPLVELVMLEKKVMPNAQSLGVQLGTQIAVQGWQHVHFIGHSAGAALIQKAADTLRNLAPATEIHTTFLDPYLDLNYYGRSWYGQNADWSDCYYALDTLTHNYTDGPLVNTYNVDVSWVDPNATISTKYCYEAGSSGSTPIANIPCGQQATSSHEWPHDFYTYSVVGAQQSCADGFGFALSKEGGGWNNHGTLTPNQTPLVPCGQPEVSQNPFPISLGMQIPINLMPNATSPTGVNFFGNGASLSSGSTASQMKSNGIQPLDNTANAPAWLAVGVTVTNSVNFVQFDAAFSDANSAQGLLTVYWNTNQIGMVDERVANTNLQTYLFTLPGTVAGGLYTLSFRLDSFDNTSSSITVTNVATGFAGITTPLTLGISLTNATPLLQLTGAPNYNYLVETSTNLVDWTPTALLVNSNGTVLFPDSTATNSSTRFYRATMP